MEDMVDDLFSVFRGTDDAERVVRSAKDGRRLAGEARYRSSYGSVAAGAASSTPGASAPSISSKSRNFPASGAARRSSPAEEAEAAAASSGPAAGSSSSCATARLAATATNACAVTGVGLKNEQGYSDAAEGTCSPAAAAVPADTASSAAASPAASLAQEATGELAAKSGGSVSSGCMGGRTVAVKKQQQQEQQQQEPGGRKKQKREQEKLKKKEIEKEEEESGGAEAAADSSSGNGRNGRSEPSAKRARHGEKSAAATAAGEATAAEGEEEGKDGKLAAFLLAEKEEEEKKKSGLLVETLASDDNCLHEVVRPTGCALRFVYYPFETTEMKVSSSSSSSSSSSPSSSCGAPSAAATASAAADAASSAAETDAAASETNSGAAGAAGPPASEAAAAAATRTVLVSTETVTAAAEGRGALGKGRGDGEEKEEEDEEEILKRYGPRPEHLPAAAARVYKFKLDTFQQRSVLALEAGENVLVAAHTSAGKTVVAEYAIAMSLRDEQRVVYTSPIKALSNQKYRDFCELFGSSSVGLLTGDVTLQPHAPVLVMTTEILRSMLYRGSSLLNAIKWVIFDEIHYMRDRERGVVWEESIILLPCSVNLVFLSATIPNAREFAAWITHLKQQPCHLFFTDYRPTPLQHYLFPAGGDGVYLVVDEKKKFREENFHKALATLNDSVEEQALQTNQQQRQRRARAARTVSNVKKIVLMCHARSYTPVIIFCFSKRECEAHATMLLPPAAAAAGSKQSRGGAGGGGGADGVDLTTPEEKQLIEEVFNNALETLEEDDRQLPQVKSILPLLKRGIGIHHGGLLPFIKEIIEILFQESLVRVLFSTETFSMGVNMPAKTVVFTAIRKWDGQEYRIINSGEYIQMAGRAGRRGLDDRGIVIIMLDEQVDPEEAKQLFLGQAAPLLSTFHLGFNMLLNLFRIEDADPLFMITRSFAYFQRNRKAMQLEQQKEELEEEVGKAANIYTLVDLEPEEKKKVDFDVETSIREYYELKHDLATFGKELQQICMRQQHIVRYLQAGRILRIVEEDGTDWGWSPCVSKVRRQLVASTNAYEGPAEVLLVECLVCCSAASAAAAAAAEGKAAAAAPDASKKLNGEKLLLQRLKLRPAASRAPAPAEKDGNSAIIGKAGAAAAAGSPKKEAAEEYVLKVLPFPITSIRSISKCRMVLPAGVDFHAADARRALHFQLQKVLQKFEPDGGVPVLDPIQDMKIQEPRVHGLVALLAEKEMRLMENPFYEHPLCQRFYEAHHRRVQMETKLREVRDALDGQKQLVMKEQLRAMRRVLRRLEFVDAHDIVTMKGRVACEITTADELVAAELLFQNVFEKMEVEVICAVLSCLVFEEKHEEVEPADEALLAGLEKVREVARHIASVYVESRYTDGTSSQQQQQQAAGAADSGEAANKAVEDYVNKFQHAMMTLTYRWAKGESFASIISDTCLYEGTVIRCMRRLEELMRQMACASKTVGNVALEKTFLEGIKKIRRGIVFSSSLYL